MKIEPLGANVLVQITKAEDEGRNGDVFVPQIDYRQREQGKVLALGKDVDPGLKVGDLVRFPADVGTYVDHEINGEPTKCLLLDHAEIRCIVES